MQKITANELKAIVDRLNTLTGSPAYPYTDDPTTGKLTANIGNYRLSFAYGGVALYRMVNEGGGVTEPLYTGHVSKRELAGRLYAYIYGIQAGLELAKNQEKAEA